VSSTVGRVVCSLASWNPASAALSGLAVSIVINQRGERRRTKKLVVPATASEGPGAAVVL
jgi:hypothetical protein